MPGMGNSVGNWLEEVSIKAHQNSVGIWMNFCRNFGIEKENCWMIVLVLISNVQVQMKDFFSVFFFLKFWFGKWRILMNSYDFGLLYTFSPKICWKFRFQFSWIFQPNFTLIRENSLSKWEHIFAWIFLFKHFDACALFLGLIFICLRVAFRTIFELILNWFWIGTWALGRKCFFF